MEIVQLLCNDHQNHLRLLQQAYENPQRFDELKAALESHLQAEETVLFPLLLQLPRTEAVVRAAWKEHNELLFKLQLLDEVRTRGKAWKTELWRFGAELAAHIEEEEHDLFPLLRETVSAVTRTELGHSAHKLRFGESAAPVRYAPVPGPHCIPENFL